MGGKKKATKAKADAATNPFDDPDEYRSFNVAQRQTIAMLMEKMNKLRDENTALRNSVKDQMETGMKAAEDQVSDDSMN